MKPTSLEADQAFIAAAMPAFISEAREQTEAIETLLLELEAQPANRELLDDLFRCAHTVKGSAGIFGLTKVVEFTHHVETLLEQMREGSLCLTPELSTLLLQCNDQIRFLVDSASNEAADTADQKDLRADLVIQLCAHTDGGQAEGFLPTPTPIASAGVKAACESSFTSWCIAANFGPETFRNGMDPLAIARYLEGMGSITSVVCAPDTVPSLLNLDPETCYLGFVMQLHSTASRDDVEGAFSFVADDCALDISAPPSADQQLVRALEDMNTTPRLGDMLVSVGAVSQRQLTDVLHQQEQERSLHSGPEAKLGHLLETQAGVAPAVVDAALSRQQKARESGAPDENRYIRVQADRLDAVINLLGELVIAGAGANLLARESRNPALTEANLHVNSLIEEIRNGTLGLRMVPVGETFSRFRRVVRDTAATLGKEVDFEIVGGEAELDKSMVEKIADPLMHLVRNALDHGLESPQERVAAGKPATGTLRLSARHETGAILIRIEDDGRGIHRERVLQRAWSRGLIEQGVVPTDDVIHMMIFEPGFSTADQVTNLSGRGVGMDVVKRNIESLRGAIQLHSRPGRGLKVDIRLPLTLAIIEGFLVGVGKSKYVLPLGSVVEVIEAGGQNVRMDASGRHCVALRGTVLPVVRLRSLYAIASSEPERTSVVVVHAAQGQYGIEVEVLLGQHQTVIKPLGRLFKGVRGISGSSILGSGEVALILDVVSLGEWVTATARQASPHPQTVNREYAP